MRAAQKVCFTTAKKVAGANSRLWPCNDAPTRAKERGLRGRANSSAWLQPHETIKPTPNTPVHASLCILSLCRVPWQTSSSALNVSNASVEQT